MKEKQIEQNIREQMLALESQMKRLQEWRKLNYTTTLCADDAHDWCEYEIIYPEPTYDVIPSVVSHQNMRYFKEIELVNQCDKCGLLHHIYFTPNATLTTDEWLEFRGGGEEE